MGSLIIVHVVPDMVLEAVLEYWKGYVRVWVEGRVDSEVIVLFSSAVYSA